MAPGALADPWLRNTGFVVETDTIPDGNADATRYTAPSGAVVFASGSHQFSWGLDDFSDVPGETRGFLDPRLQQFMRNALDAMTR